MSFNHPASHRIVRRGRIILFNMDPNNPIVKLCIEGMAMEGSGQPTEAAQIFTAAWNTATNDSEACVAAHYVARHQPSPEESLRWNQLSLDRASLAPAEEVAAFYPSLYLNLGKAHEDLGHFDEARRFYELAQSQFNVLADNRYGNVVHDAVKRGLARLDLLVPKPSPLEP